MKTIIKKLLPKRYKRSLLKHYTEIVRQMHARTFLKRDAQIPLCQLQHKHLQHLQALPDRLALLNVMPKHAVVAELGVDMGEFSEAILEYNDPKKLHLIDAWPSSRYHKGKRDMVVQKFNEAIESGQVQLHEGYSTDLVVDFPDHYFDWIYVDTDHSYKTTLTELELYHIKVKPGGYIAGHDFILGNWISLLRYGVIDAVYEFCIKYNWEMVYLTMEHKAHPSFAIKKIIEHD
ncbi:class I SAM-dependent methyltransferase [Aestuariivivens sediminis]|uniref:class I SAM-dependent methyltransferase n=1 Tax=Aestuariivivens sediminis TaxID=2913557 RepID=UPI001F5816FF|nr:class I SAM-dependent methyltransferase [Aestuariivivens sediminis]